MKIWMLMLGVVAAVALAPAAKAEEKAAKTENTEGAGADAKAEAKTTKPKGKLMGGDKVEKKQAGADKGKKAKASKRADGLVIEDVKEGNGPEAKLGSKITVHYRGTFLDGKEFDSSYKGGQPITFPLEEGRLIKGWTEGIPGMKVGGKRKLMVPYQMAYGENGTPDGTIGPKKDLNFEVELLKVE